MAGRWKKIAATTIAVALYPGNAAAEMPGVAAEAVVPRAGASAPAELGFHHAGADTRFSLAAAATRAAFDPMEPPTSLGEAGFARRFARQDAAAGEMRRARIALDWQRTEGRSRFTAGAYAAGSQLELQPDRVAAASALDERYLQRDRRTRIGAVIASHDMKPLFGMPASRSLALRAGNEALDGHAALQNAFHGASRDVADDRVRQGVTALEVLQQARPAAALRVEGGLNLQRYDLAVDAAQGASARFQGTLASARATMSLTLGPAEIFVSSARGLMPGEAAACLAAVDPRSGTVLPALDPRTRTTFSEAGVRHTWASGAEARLSGWHATTPAELRFSGDEAWSEIARAGVRSGVRAAVRYEPTRWLALDLDATLLRARFADAAREPIAFAAQRLATAGATLRGVGGWTASLFVSYLGPRQAAEDEPMRMRSSTVVNAQVLRRLSKTTRVSLDVFNVFDHRVGEIDHFAASRLGAVAGASDNFLFHPAEPRGFRIKLRTTF